MLWFKTSNIAKLVPSLPASLSDRTKPFQLKWKRRKSTTNQPPQKNHHQQKEKPSVHTYQKKINKKTKSLAKLQETENYFYDSINQP